MSSCPCADTVVSQMPRDDPWGCACGRCAGTDGSRTTHEQRWDLLEKLEEHLAEADGPEHGLRA
jgi:hypothetical protein